MALLFGFVLAGVQRLSPGGLVTIPFVVAVLAVGLALLLGLAPLHFWVPAAFQRAGPVSIALATGLLGPASVGLLLQALSAQPQLVVDERVNSYLSYGGLFTAIFGAFAALAPGSLRRRAGYVFVSDAGFIVAGMATYTRIGVAGAALHLAHRSLLALVLAGAAAELERAEGNAGNCGKACSAPYLWGTLLLGALSLVGLPPLSGFAAAWPIYQAVSLVDWRPATVLALTSVTCLGALLAGLGDLRREYEWPWQRPRAVEAWLLALAAFTAVWGLAPGPFLDAVHRAVSQLPFLRPF
jgi:formate hydrogenlyase subunit 3/multisubunit Na+/H+ antiporter MnhD subunit